MDIHDDTVAVYDRSGNMKLFTAEGAYLDCIALDGHAPSGDFVMREGRFYFPAGNFEAGAFVRLSVGDCTPFGVATPNGETEFPIPGVGKRRYVYIHGDKPIAVSQFIPLIEVYDMESLQLEEGVRYDRLPLVGQNIRSTKEVARSGDFVGAAPIIRDCCFYGDMMYVSVPDRSDGKYRCNKVVAFDIGKGIEPVALYVLGEDAYGSICADGDYIYAFDTNNSAICKIALP